MGEERGFSGRFRGRLTNLPAPFSAMFGTPHSCQDRSVNGAALAFRPHGGNRTNQSSERCSRKTRRPEIESPGTTIRRSSATGSPFSGGRGYRKEPLSDSPHLCESSSVGGGDPMWVASQMGHAEWEMIRKRYGQ